jgi:magnesium transporter
MVGKVQNMNICVADYIHNDYIALDSSNTVEEAIKSLRKNSSSDQISYLYIIEQEKLVGITPIRELLFRRQDTKLKDIMIKRVVKLSVNDKLKHAADVFAKKKFLALPVVDEENHLLGIIDIKVFTDDAIKLIQEQETEKIFQIIGVHILSDKNTSTWLSFTNRFPWLLSNMASGIICALIASFYEFLIAEVVILAMFMTVVLALAESVSIQVTTITTLLMPERKIKLKQFLYNISKEISVAFLIGLGSATIIGAVSYFWKQSIIQSLSIFFSIILSIMGACSFGVIVPYLIKTLKFDPKIAAGPIVLAMADIFTLIIYFNLMYFMVKPV